MALSDSKKAQTAINLLRDYVTKPVADADALAGLIRQAIIDNSITGEFSAGELAALQTFETDLTALANSSVVTAIENRYQPTHRNKAITIAGVND